MGKINDIWTGFQSGELSPLLDGQVNMNEYKFGAKTMQNFIPHVQGPVSNRPGFRYITGAKSDTKKVRLIPFEYSTEQAYILEVGEQYIRFYKDQGQIQGTPSTWKLVLKGDGTDASTSVLDSSGTPKIVTAVGNAQLDTEFWKFGTGSILFNGTTDYLTTPDHADFDFSALDWVVDMWIRPQVGGGATQTLFSQRELATTDYIVGYLNAYTKLLIHAEGVEGSTVITDSSVFNKAFTVVGNAQITTSDYKFGSSGLLFDGTGDFIHTPDHADFDLSSEDGTIDFWVKFDTLADNMYLMGQAVNTGDSNWFIYAKADGRIAIGLTGLSETITASGAVTTGSWYHLAFVKSSGTTKIYVNGVEKASSATAVFNNATTSFYIGGNTGTQVTITGAYFDGKMDEIRFSKGLAVWTANFTPSTSAYTKVLHPKMTIADVGTGDSSLVGTSDNVALDEWTHIMFGGNAGTGQHYLFTNGQLDASGTLTYNPSGAYDRVFMIGAYNEASPTQYYKGNIDEVRVAKIASPTASFIPRTLAYGEDSAELNPYEIATPYLESEIDDVKYAQSADTLYLVHKNYPPKKLVRNPPSHASWTLSNLPIVNAPKAWNTGSYPSTVTFYENRLWFGYSTNKVCASQTGDYYNFVPSDVGTSSELVANANWTNYATAGHLTATVASNTDKWMTGFKVQMTTTTTLPTGLALTTDYYIIRVDATHVRFATTAQNAWDNTPIAWTDAGTGDHTITLQGTSCSGASCAMIYSLLSQQVNEIQWMSSGKHLMFGTTGAEYKLSASSLDEAVTATNIKIVVQSTYGSADLSALTVKDSVLYIQRGGRKLREMAYSLERDSYVSPDMTQLAEHMTKSGIKWMAYAPEPYSIVWFGRVDGTLIGMTYARDNETVAWHKHPTEGTFEYGSTIPSTTTGNYELWVVTNRTINGSPVKYIEVLQDGFPQDGVLEDAFFVDAGYTYDVAGVPISTVTDLAYLEGKTVSVLADGVVFSKVVTSGSITLDAAADKIHLGLPYTSILQTMRYSGNDASGTMQGQPKRINKAVARLLNAKQFKYAQTTSNMMERTFDSLYTGDVELDMTGGTNREGYVTIKNDKPLPITVIAIIPEVNTQ